MPQQLDSIALTSAPGNGAQQLERGVERAERLLVAVAVHAQSRAARRASTATTMRPARSSAREVFVGKPRRARARAPRRRRETAPRTRRET